MLCFSTHVGDGVLIRIENSTTRVYVGCRDDADEVLEDVEICMGKIVVNLADRKRYWEGGLTSWCDFAVIGNENDVSFKDVGRLEEKPTQSCREAVRSLGSRVRKRTRELHD